MIKSLEIKRGIGILKNKMQGLIDNKEAIPEEMQAEMNELLAELELAEVEEKKGEQNMVNVSKKQFNDALKNFLRTKDSAKYIEVYNAATGNNGAISGDGGALVPEEMLGLVENDAVGVDLRALTASISVSTRSGKIPCIDYSQDVALVNFDENNEIAETKAAFTQLTFNLASKGALVPVSNELLMDAQADVLGVIGKLFNRVYVKDVNKSIIAEATKDITATNVADIASVAAIDAIKTAIIKCPLDAGANATIVMNQNTWAKLACTKDKDDCYLLARDANNSTIKNIEGRPIVVVEATDMDSDKIIVGDFRAIYHIAYPDLEVQSSAEAGFTTNSVKVRAICRFTDKNTYTKAFSVISQG